MRQGLLGFLEILLILLSQLIDAIVADVFLQITEVVSMILAEIRSNIQLNEEIVCEFD